MMLTDRGFSRDIARIYDWLCSWWKKLCFYSLINNAHFEISKTLGFWTQKMVLTMIFLEIESCFLFIMKRRYHRFWRQEKQCSEEANYQSTWTLRKVNCIWKRKCCTVYGQKRE
jgi:hypothetical protein